VGSHFADTINGIGALTRKADPLLEIGVLSTLAARDLAQCLPAFDAPWRDLFENSIHQAMRTGLAEQVLTPLSEVIGDLLYPPGTVQGDLRLVFRWNIDEERRAQAIARIVGHIRWVPRGLLLWRALRQRAERERISVEELKHRELCAALLLVLATDDQAQRIRIGRQWFTDENGHIEPVVPLDLDFDQYWQWLRNKAIATAEDSILDCPARGPWRARDVLDPPSSPNQPSPIVRIDAGPDRWNQNDLADPADVDPLLWLLAHEQQVERAALLRSLVQIATPRQRQLLALLHEGLNTADAARLLGIEPETARTQLKRLRDKARQTLWWKIV
jgi:DNA-binding CsgD family transcriptional regulator